MASAMSGFDSHPDGPYLEFALAPMNEYDPSFMSIIDNKVVVLQIFNAHYMAPVEKTSLTYMLNKSFLDREMGLINAADLQTRFQCLLLPGHPALWVDYQTRLASKLSARSSPNKTLSPPEVFHGKPAGEGVPVQARPGLVLPQSDAPPTYDMDQLLGLSGNPRTFDDQLHFDSTYFDDYSLDLPVSGGTGIPSQVSNPSFGGVALENPFVNNTSANHLPVSGGTGIPSQISNHFVRGVALENPFVNNTSANLMLNGQGPNAWADQQFTDPEFSTYFSLSTDKTDYHNPTMSGSINPAMIPIVPEYEHIQATVNNSMPDISTPDNNNNNNNNTPNTGAHNTGAAGTGMNELSAGNQQDQSSPNTLSSVYTTAPSQEAVQEKEQEVAKDTAEPAEPKTPTKNKEANPSTELSANKTADGTPVRPFWLRPTSGKGRFVHSICGKVFTRGWAVKAHHEGRSTTGHPQAGCWRRHGCPNIAWDADPSCKDADAKRREPKEPREGPKCLSGTNETPTKVTVGPRRRKQPEQDNSPATPSRRDRKLAKRAEETKKGKSNNNGNNMAAAGQQPYETIMTFPTQEDVDAIMSGAGEDIDQDDTGDYVPN